MLHHTSHQFQDLIPSHLPVCIHPSWLLAPLQHTDMEDMVPPLHQSRSDESRSNQRSHPPATVTVTQDGGARVCFLPESLPGLHLQAHPGSSMPALSNKALHVSSCLLLLPGLLASVRGTLSSRLPTLKPVGCPGACSPVRPFGLVLLLDGSSQSSPLCLPRTLYPCTSSLTLTPELCSQPPGFQSPSL